MYYSTNTNFTQYDFFQVPKFVLSGDPLYIFFIPCSCGRCKWAPKKKYDPVFRHVYNAHREDVSNGLKIRCLLCQNDEVFMNTSAEFNKHMGQKHSLNYQKYRCSYCRFGTESARNLLCHKKFQHPSLPHYACDYCPTKFFNEDTKNRYLIH